MFGFHYRVNFKILKMGNVIFFTIPVKRNRWKQCSLFFAPMKDYADYRLIGIGPLTAPLKVSVPKFEMIRLISVAPNNILQVYTINSLIDHSSVPGAFILMAAKTQQTYIRVLNALHDRLNIAPNSIMLDFEQGY